MSHRWARSLVPYICLHVTDLPSLRIKENKHSKKKVIFSNRLQTTIELSTEQSAVNFVALEIFFWTKMSRDNAKPNFQDSGAPGSPKHLTMENYHPETNQDSDPGSSMCTTSMSMLRKTQRLFKGCLEDSQDISVNFCKKHTRKNVVDNLLEELSQKVAPTWSFKDEWRRGCRNRLTPKGAELFFWSNSTRAWQILSKTCLRC